MNKLRTLINKMYPAYKDCLPAGLWALLILILIFVVGFANLYVSKKS